MVQSIKNLIAATLIAISGFLCWTEVLPVYDLTSGLKDLIAEKEIVLSARAEIAQKIKQLNEEYGSRYAELQRLALLLPKTKSLPEIISMVEAMFSQTGNVIGEYLMSDASQAGSNLKTVTLTLSSEGTYGSFINLLNIIENNIRLLDVTSLDISENLESAGSDPRLNLQIKGNTYWLQQEAVKILPQRKPAANVDDSDL